MIATRAAAPPIGTEHPQPSPSPSSGSSSIITDSGIYLRTIWHVSLCKGRPHRGSPWPDCYLETPCWAAVVFKDNSFSHCRELISFQQGCSPTFAAPILKSEKPERDRGGGSRGTLISTISRIKVLYDLKDLRLLDYKLRFN